MKKRKVRKVNRSKLERKLDEVNHTMELIRTVIPLIILIVQIIILDLITLLDYCVFFS